MTWLVEIRRMWHDKEVQRIKAHCFPYNVNPRFSYPTSLYEPPYPGFEVLEKWLDDNALDIGHERLYNQGNPVLELTFPDCETAFWFALEKGM